MKIVIKISDEDYKAIAKGYLPYGAIADAIRNGISLPKNHGRLIDADALWKKWVFDNIGKQEIDEAPTIIEGSDSE